MHLGYVQFGTMMNNASRNSYVQVFMWMWFSFLWGKFLGVQLLSSWPTFVFKKLPNRLPKWLDYSMFPSVGVIRFEWYVVLSLFLPLWLWFAFRWWLLMQIFSCVYLLSIYSLWNVCSCLCPGSNWIVWFLLLSFESSL